VRSQPRAARDLWAAGDELVGAQERLLAGRGGRDDLRAAATAEREALAPLLDAARGLLTGGGAAVSETALARVEESLHAAALDPEVRTGVAAGRLAKELRHVGMGTAGAPATVRTQAAGGAKAQRGAKAAGGERAGHSVSERQADGRCSARKAAKQRVDDARGERAAARDGLKAARKESRSAAAGASAAVKAADAARRDADRATAAAREAAERERAARDALDAAEAALRSAREGS